jgi:hypothetical protein
MMRRLISSLVVGIFCVTGSAAFAQLGGAKKAGSTTKEAGKATVDTTKDAAKATEKGTKKVAGETKDAVQTTYICVDGTTDQATLKANACKAHEGVKADAKARHWGAKPQRWLTGWNRSTGSAGVVHIRGIPDAA